MWSKALSMQAPCSPNQPSIGLPLSLVVVTCGYLQYKQVNAKRRILVQDPTHQWDIAGREKVVRQPYNDHSLLREFILDTRDDRCRICSNYFCPWRNKYI